MWPRRRSLPNPRRRSWTTSGDWNAVSLRRASWNEQKAISGDSMRSSSGAHYIALDHVRALAAFMVFAWHFTHAWNGYPIPFEYAPAVFPLSLLDEGHTGVALFMTLSGYLFAKLVGDRRVDFPNFLWSRAVRLGPLL